MLMPPLRERRSDIPQLAGEFLKRFNEENSRALRSTPSALEVLMGCGFPGNVRELENCVQRTATLAHGPSIVMDDFACRHNQCLSAMLWKGHSESRRRALRPVIPLPVLPRRPAEPAAAQRGGQAPAGGRRRASAFRSAGRAAELRQMPERERLIEAMERSGWVQAKAAPDPRTDAAPDRLCAEKARASRSSTSEPSFDRIELSSAPAERADASALATPIVGGATACRGRDSGRKLARIDKSNKD